MKKQYIIICLLLILLLLGCSKESKKVLLVFSYHSDYFWHIEQLEGVDEVFLEKGLTIEKFFMDTKRNTSDEWKKEIAEKAVEKIEIFNPDLVIVFDDNACELVAKQFAGKSLPFVFCGMNGEPEDYGFPAENITGVVERELWVDTIHLVKELVPDIKSVAIMTDASPTGLKSTSRLENMEFPVKIAEIVITNDFDTWKAKLVEFQSKVDVIGISMFFTLKTKDSEASLSAEEVLDWTIENNTLPEFASMAYAVRNGALCGVSFDGFDQGKLAAEMALEILGGKKPSDIPITPPEYGQPMVNEKRAKELNIEIPAHLVEKIEIVK
jgi:ABC-type uncharacterized transport system substrate-binding protein